MEVEDRSTIKQPEIRPAIFGSRRLPRSVRHNLKPKVAFLSPDWVSALALTLG